MCASCASPVKQPEVEITGILVGVDPGPTPGFAVKIEGLYATATYDSPSALYVAIKALDPANTKLAVENFHRSNKIDTYMIATMECVGGVKACCIVLGIPFVTQTPGHQQAWYPDAKKHLSRGVTLHEQSALGHLMLFEDNLKKGKVKL